MKSQKLQLSRWPVPVAEPQRTTEQSTCPLASPGPEQGLKIFESEANPGALDRSWASSSSVGPGVLRHPHFCRKASSECRRANIILPSTSLVFSSVNKQGILPSLAGKPRSRSIFWAGLILGQQQAAASCQQSWSSSSSCSSLPVPRDGSQGEAAARLDEYFGRLNAIRRTNISCLRRILACPLPCACPSSVKSKVSFPKSSPGCVSQDSKLRCKSRYLQGRHSNAQSPLTPSHVSGYKWLLNFKTNSLFQILSFWSIYNFKYLSLPLPQPTCWYVKWGTCWQIGCKCFFSFPYHVQNIQITPSWTHINSQLCLFRSCKADLTVRIDTRK